LTFLAGYCQSMNFIAGGLLLFLEEEEAFWMLCFIVEEMLPDYFTKNIIGPQIDAEVLTELMGEQLPELRDHFECKGVNTVLVSTQWFMCLFIRTLPFECAFRIWDSLFLYGPQVLFEVGLAILKMHQKELLTLEDTTDIVTHLGNSLSDLFDCSSIWEIAVARVDHKRIGSSREIHKERVMRDMRMKKDILDLMDAIPHSKFSRETLEELYIQYANLSPKLDDEDVVATGLPKSVFHKVISRICQWKHEEYFMDRLFKMFDTNCNQRVDFKELISGLSILIKGTNEEKLRMCFVLFDRNSDGYVDRDELREMLTSLYTLCNGTSESSKPVPIQNGGSLSSHSLLVQNGGLLLQNGAHCTNTLTHSGGAQSTNSLTHSGGAQSTNSLTHSGGAQSSTPSTPPTPVSAARSFLVRVQSSRLLQLGLGSPSLTQNGSAPEPAKPKAPASDPTQHKAPANDPAQATTTRGASDPARPKLFASDPGRTTPPASDPEKDKNATPDYSSEVAFFVDMLFKKADVTKDGLLSPTEFREAALLHPFILKTFNLDHQQNYDVRISIE
jgi:Ca2+-binding EF-hand superfamily protein